MTPTGTAIDEPKTTENGRAGALRLIVADWFAPSTGGPAGRLSPAIRMLLFVELVVVAFGIVWLGLNLLQNALTLFMARTMQLFATLGDYPVRFWASGQEVYFEISHGKRFQAWLDTRPIFSNLPVLVALIAATPGLLWRRRLAYVLTGAALLFLTHLIFLYVKVQVVLITANHIDAGSPALWQSLDDMFEVTGKTFFPIFIWLLLAFPYMLGAVDARKRKEALALPRNALCPCGSGKKYKRCCGR